MLFAEPMAEYIRDTDGKRIDIVGVSWGGTELVTSETGGLWVTFWSVTDFAAIKSLARAAGATTRQAEMTARRQHAELTWDNEIYRERRRQPQRARRRTRRTCAAARPAYPPGNDRPGTGRRS